MTINEVATRDLFIDLLLKGSGLALDQPRDREFGVTGMPNNEGKGFVDSCCGAAAPLALVEANAPATRCLEGQQQARPVCRLPGKSTSHRPVIYGTNGQEHWMWDDATSPVTPGVRGGGFHTS